MKVVLVASLSEEGWKSSNLYAENIYQKMKLMGMEIKLIGLGEEKTARTFLSKSKKILKKIFVLPFQILLSSGDIIHILDHSYAFLIPFAIFFKKKIVTCHSPMFEVIQNKTERSNFKYPYYIHMIFYYLSLKAMKFADKIICVSKYVEEDLKNNKLLFTTVVHMPISDVFFNKKTSGKKNFYSEFNLSKKNNFFIHVGRNWKGNKNIELILSFIANNKRYLKKNNMLFLKVGSPFLKSQNKFIKENKIEKFIIHLGKLSQEKLKLAYLASFCLVFPSFYEGYPAPPQEALAMFKPTIISKTLFANGDIFKFCFEIDPNSIYDLKKQLQFLFESKEKKISQVVKGRESLLKDRWDNIIYQTRKIYSLLNE
jgi:mannosyltransferase